MGAETALIVKPRQAEDAGEAGVHPSPLSTGRTGLKDGITKTDYI